MKRWVHPCFGLIASGMLAGLAVGCHGPAMRGESSFEVLGAPEMLRAGASAKDAVEETGERIEYIPLRGEAAFAKPIYPAAALTAGVGEYTLYVSVTFDERGQVVDVVPNWRRIEVRNAFTDAFHEAVRTAVATWKVSPARQVYYERMQGGEERYLRTEAVAETVEIKFTFEASGDVR